MAAQAADVQHDVAFALDQADAMLATLHSLADPALPMTEAAVRMRDTGHTFAVEVLAVPKSEDDVVPNSERLAQQIRDLDWKLQDVVVAAVAELRDAPPDVLV